MHPAFRLLAVGLLTLIAGCDDVPTSSVTATTAPRFALGAGRGPSATGHLERELGFGVIVEKYSFTAQLLGNGEFGGRFNVRDYFEDGSDKASAKGRVTCFTVEPDGRRARMGGVVEEASDPTLKGTEAVWTVQDNGEGGAPEEQDQGTDLRWGLPPGFAETHCTTGFPPEAFGTYGESARGNVQVRP